MARTMLYRRKREGRTNYKKRLIYLKGGRPRLVIRKTNTQILMQVVTYEADGDKVLCAVNSNMLRKLGWNYSCNNMPACYLAGVLLGKKAKDAKIKEAILDMGLQSNVPGARVYAALKGAVDGGLKVPVSPEVLPSKERISGAHIADYYSKSENAVQFSGYKQKSIDASKISDNVENTKKKILG